MQLTMKIFSNTITAGARSTSLRVIGALAAMALLLWTIRYGYEAATEPRRRPLYGPWISGVGALIMLFGFLLLAMGLPIMIDLFLRLAGELQYPEKTDLHPTSNLKEKVDDSV